MKVTDTIASLLERKGAVKVFFIEPNQTVYEAIERLAEEGVGALLVIANDKLVGILSERDYARKVILKGHSSKDTRDHDQPGDVRDSTKHSGRVHGPYDLPPFPSFTGGGGWIGGGRGIVGRSGQVGHFRSG